jgi:hypothetical protein
LLLRARREPVWGQFLIREGFSARVLERGLGQRLLRDIQKGIVAKRFATKDPLVSFISVGGTVLASISAELQFGAAQGPQAEVVKALGFTGDGLAERAAAIILCNLGLSQAEADKISRRQLPVVNSDS